MNHYWVLNRCNEHKNVNVIGEVKLPYHGITSNQLETQLKMSSILENKEAFDSPIDFKEKDRLQVVLNNTSKNREDVMAFEFEYTAGKWRCIADEDSFYLINNFDELDSGEIQEMD